MSINVNWDSFQQEPQQTSWVKSLLTDALNSSKRTNALSSKIEISEFELGKIPPTIETLEIGELAADKFRGIFKLKYDGDGFMKLNTSIQANPMNVYSFKKNAGLEFVLPELSIVNQDFKIPVSLKISSIKISGIMVVVFNKSKGMTLVFKNDPLESIDISSTFDDISKIKGFLQFKIESQVKDLFRNILPNLLYQISQKWTIDLHKQLLTNNNQTFGYNDEIRILFSDITPDDDEFFNVLRSKIDELEEKKLSLSTNIAQNESHDNFLSRSMVQKYLESKYGSVFSVPIASELFKYSSNGLPINELTKMGEPNMVDKIIQDINKIQTHKYQNETKSAKLKPKRRRIKIKTESKFPQTPPNEIKPTSTSKTTTPISVRTSPKSPLINKSYGSCVFVDEEDEEYESSNASLNATLDESFLSDYYKNSTPKRALSSSSMGVEHLKLFYQEKQQKARIISNSPKRSPRHYSNNSNELRPPLSKLLILNDSAKLSSSNKEDINYTATPNPLKRISFYNQHLGILRPHNFENSGLSLDPLFLKKQGTNSIDNFFTENPDDDLQLPPYES